MMYCTTCIMTNVHTHIHPPKSAMWYNLIVDSLIGSDTNTFLRCLADWLSMKWDHPYSSVLYWLRTRLSFALVRVTNLCIRGSQSKIQSLNFEDGAGIYLFSVFFF